MLKCDSRFRIHSIAGRRILNSHVGFTNEFTVRLENGCLGVGASPQGETISVFEDRSTRADAKGIADEIVRDPCIQASVSQTGFDQFLHQRLTRFGRNNCWALSLAFFHAAHFPLSRFWSLDGEPGREFPRLCLNVLNGGRHAYTNPVLSDFPEYLLVPTGDDVRKVVRDHAAIQQEVKERLATCERVCINGNPVFRFKTLDNRECLAFLHRVLDRLGLSGDYDMMIDASAGDLRTADGYRFSVTDSSVRSTAALRDYWQGLIGEFGLRFLEDPFAEDDVEGWSGLAGSGLECKIIGDNLYSSDADRIQRGALEGLTHGVVIKPNQAGTVTAVLKALEAARKFDQIAVTSHRSISTESTFLSLLTVLEDVGHMKIGPLQTDYSSVLRFNELIRLTGVDCGD
jgi:enolase